MNKRIEVLQSIPLADRQRFFAQEDRRRKPSGTDVAGKMGTYIEEHPTTFNWRWDVRGLVSEIESKWPWLTYVNTYWWHPPYDAPEITIRYDRRSFDVWGGGVYGGEYNGYRGKALPDYLHEQIFNYVFYEQPRPIYWVCTNGWLWVRGSGWTLYDPYDPYDADMGHYKHLHFTIL